MLNGLFERRNFFDNLLDMRNCGSLSISVYVCDKKWYLKSKWFFAQKKNENSIFNVFPRQGVIEREREGDTCKATRVCVCWNIMLWPLCAVVLCVCSVIMLTIMWRGHAISTNNNNNNNHNLHVCCIWKIIMRMRIPIHSTTALLDYLCSF